MPDVPYDVYPLRYIERPLVLPKKMLELHGVLRINLSTDKVAHPITIAPSVSYGVMPKLQIGVVHDPGICVFGKHDFPGTMTEVDECKGGIYDDFAVDGKYLLLDKPEKHVAVAGHATLGALTFDPVLMYLRLGALARYTLGSRLAVIADWALRFGLSNRNEGSGNKETLDLPIQLAIQATDRLVLFFEAGLVTPLEELTDRYTTSLGAAGLYAFSANLDVGARFELPTLSGGKATGSSASADTRQLDLFLTYRR